MKTLTNKDLFDQSIHRWGIGFQLQMLAEEASELAVAALHLNRTTKDKTKAILSFAEELADAQFMIDEFMYYFKENDVQGKRFFDLVQQFRACKELKLEALLLKEREPQK